MKKGTYVVVTTGKRGVFCGKLEVAVTSIPETLRLLDVRQCIYWDVETKGFIGLSANGPTANCRIGPASANILLDKIDSIAECSGKALEAWRKEPWK